MRGPGPLRALGGAALAALMIGAGPSTAFADPPGPTDFETTIIAVEPQIETVSVSFVGGDSFFVLEAEPGVAVEIAGYQGEPFIEIAPSGAVRENRNSPTYHQSQSKQGTIVPPGITAESPPDWVTVASGGTYAWHDHRTHWMGGTPPGERGDVVWRGEVPLTVDGAPAVVRVETRWLEPASPAFALAGGAIGAVLGGAYVLGRRRSRPGEATADTLLAGAAALALAIGLVAYRSVPAVTGPSILAWVLPATAAAVAAIGAIIRRRPTVALFAVGAEAFAGVELAIWAFGRRSGLTAAILPTDAPFWLDRSATAAVGVTGVVVAAYAAIRMVELVTRPAVVSAPARPPVRT